MHQYYLTALLLGCSNVFMTFAWYVAALAVFLPFPVYFLKGKPSSDYLWAGLCLLGAVFFIFRAKIMGT